MLKLGWFSTGRGPGSRGLFSFVQERILRGEIDARIQFVFSNREPGEHEGSDEFFKLVQGHHIPLVQFSSRKFRHSVGGDFAAHRVEYDREIMARLKDYDPDLCVLAGYMLIVGPEMCRRYTLLNLHPALPWGPVGEWQDVIWELIRTRARETGAMMHLAIEEVDRGPVLTYFSIPIQGGQFEPLWRAVEGKSVEELKAQQGEELPLFKLIRQEEYRREPYLLAETIKAVASGKVRIIGGKPCDSQGNLLPAVCLNDEIEAALARG